jgi:hypothetical protein
MATMTAFSSESVGEVQLHKKVSESQCDMLSLPVIINDEQACMQRAYHWKKP